MANNVVEEFFISIGFDTKRVKKESKEIEKVLDQLVNKKRKVVSAEAKEKAKAYKQQRSSEADNFKHFLKQEDLKVKHKKQMLRDELAAHKIHNERIRRMELSRGIDKRGASRTAASIRGSAAYRKAERSGNVGTIGAQITAAAMAGNIGELRSLKDKLTAVNRETVKLTKNQKKQTVVQKGLSDSTRNMIRSYASVFALFQGTVAIKRVGQDFESLRASMLVVSEDKDDAAKKLKFVRDEAYRLGIDVRTASKAFMQLSASSGDALGEKGVKRLFTSVLGISKAFGMSVDDTKGTFKAFTQMLSKGNVQAEELRGQLGERLFGAFNLASKAMGKTTKEMNKALETGQVTAKEMLPKLIPLMEELAEKNRALAEQIVTAQSAQNRFNTDMEEGADTIWVNGMSEGLKDLFETMSKLFKNSQPQLKKLGRIFEIVFKAMARVLELVTPLLQFVIDHMGVLFGSLMLSKVYAMTTGVTAFGTASALAFAKALAPLTAIIASFGLIDDWLAQFDSKKISLSEAAQGFQIVNGKRIGIEEKDGKYYSTGKQMDSEGENYWLHSKLQSMFGYSLDPTKNGVNNTNTTTKEIKATIDITGVPTTEIGLEVERTLSGMLTGNMAGISQ